MINFNYETEFHLVNEQIISKWISNTILNEGCKEGDINYVFCDDDYLVMFQYFVFNIVNML